MGWLLWITTGCLRSTENRDCCFGAGAVGVQDEIFQILLLVAEQQQKAVVVYEAKLFIIGIYKKNNQKILISY
jgi:hypothetical protein